MWLWFHKLGSPPHFYRFAGKLAPWLGASSLLLMLAGLYGGLVLAPTDYQQGDSYRIIYVHVPSAWMSMFAYVFMAVNAAIGIIWRMKLAEIMASATAPIGATFTLLALVTGAVWGKPTWGTWWVWDARLTSELFLLFLYLGFMALEQAIDDRRQAARAAGLLAIVGVINVPIIHYSVQWWHTLHQGPILTSKGFSLQTEMLVPLLLMAVACQIFFFYVLLLRGRAALLTRERNARWVRDLVTEHG